MDTAPVRLIATALRVTAMAERKRRRVQIAARRMPRPVPWDWAEPRIMPLLSGPCFDPPGSELVRLTSSLGPAIEFGLDLGSTVLRVDHPVAERWECSAEQLLATGLANLRRRAERLSATDVTTAVMSGYRIRLLDRRPHWASSILLDLPTLTRLFGDQDQFIAAPRADCLVTAPINTPPRVFADIALGLEDQWNSLWLDPFLLESGELIWESSLPDEEED